MASQNSFRPDTPLPTDLHSRSRHLQDAQKGSVSPLTSELLIAARKGYSKEVKRILTEGGGSVAAATTDKHGRNCLHLACHYGQLDTVLTILNMDIVDINCTSKRGFTPLHEASGEGQLNVVYLLLAMGAFLKVRSKEGWTALMSACYNGHLNVAKVLIAAGLEVNATNKHGFTALHVAAWKGNTGIVELLIKEGCVITMATSNKKTALDIAKEENQHETITILQAASVRESEQPFYRIAALESQLKLMQEKVLQAQQKYEEALAAERAVTAENFSKMKQQLREELDHAKSESKLLCGKIDKNKEESQKCEMQIDHESLEDEDPSINTSTTTDKGATGKISKKNKNAKGYTGIVRLNRESVGSIPIIASPLINRTVKKRNSERETMDILGLDPLQDTVRLPIDDKPRRSFEGQKKMFITPRPNGDKLTITQLIEDSLHNPGTIASIRKQLKKDGLTPKIERKFKQDLPPMLEATNSLQVPSAPLEGGKKMSNGDLS